MLRLRHLLPLSLGVCLALALCAGSGSASAAPATSLADTQAKAAEARSKLAAMRSQLDTGMSAYNTAADALSATRAEIASNNKQLAKVKASLKVRQDSLDAQAEFLYRTDGAGFVDVLLGAKTFEEFAARLSVLQTIASKDAGLVAGLKQDRAEVAQLLSSLHGREARQRALVVKVGAQRDNVQGALDRQQSYLSSLSSQVAALVAAQEKAAAAVSTTHSSGSSRPSGGSAPPAKPSPPTHRGSTKLKLATVTGKGSNWWVMASESSVYRPTGNKFSGVASEYGTNDNGTGTASGRPLNDSELTCAHPSLPFGTRIAVTHGSKHCIVIVTDRGPYTGGRVIDLTHRAAGILGIDGIGQVKCEIVDPQ